jgi:hypothetical protein
MSHKATATFWKCYLQLPESIRDVADKNFQLLQENPRHPSLQLKKVGELWSARVGINHRALALEDSEGLTWIWIGDHSQYDRLLR